MTRYAFCARHQPGADRDGDVALRLSRPVSAFGPTRNQLITKGVIRSPNHGHTAFTVPLFDEFMRRIMPGDDPQRNRIYRY